MHTHMCVHLGNTHSATQAPNQPHPLASQVHVHVLDNQFPAHSIKNMHSGLHTTEPHTNSQIRTLKE